MQTLSLYAVLLFNMTLKTRDPNSTKQPETCGLGGSKLVRSCSLSLSLLFFFLPMSLYLSKQQQVVTFSFETPCPFPCNTTMSPNNHDQNHNHNHSLTYTSLRESPQEREESEYYTIRTLSSYANHIGRSSHSPTCALALLRRVAAACSGRITLHQLRTEIAAAELTGLDTGRLRCLEEVGEVAARAGLTVEVLLDMLKMARSEVVNEEESEFTFGRREGA